MQIGSSSENRFLISFDNVIYFICKAYPLKLNCMSIPCMTYDWSDTNIVLISAHLAQLFTGLNESDDRIEELKRQHAGIKPLHVAVVLRYTKKTNIWN